MFKRSISTILFCTVLLLASCNKNKLDINVSKIDASVELKRFDLALFEIDEANFETELSELKSKYPAVFKLAGFTMEDWKNQYSDSFYRELHKEIKSKFNTIEKQEKELETILKHFKYYYPKKTTPTVYTYISGLDYELPILYLDSILFISTDNFLGANSSFYNTLPKYLAEDYSMQFLASEVAKEIGKSVNKPVEANPTLLDYMIYHGKLLYFADAMMPKKDDHIKIRYTPEEIEWSKANEYNIWSNLVNNELLFSKKNAEVQRFIDPAPFTKFYLKIDNQSPGRLGRWLGWQIVREYMDNNDVTLQELMDNNNAEEILKNSKYKPNK